MENWQKAVVVILGLVLAIGRACGHPPYPTLKQLSYVCPRPHRSAERQGEGAFQGLCRLQVSVVIGLVVPTCARSPAK